MARGTGRKRGYGRGHGTASRGTSKPTNTSSTGLKVTIPLFSLLRSGLQGNPAPLDNGGASVPVSDVSASAYDSPSTPQQVETHSLDGPLLPNEPLPVSPIPTYFANFEPSALDTLHDSQWHVEIDGNRCRGFAECECLVNGTLLGILWVVASQRCWRSDAEGCCDVAEGCCNSKESLFTTLIDYIHSALDVQMQNQNPH